MPTEDASAHRRRRHKVSRRVFLRRLYLLGLPVAGAAGYGIDALVTSASPKRRSVVTSPRSPTTTTTSPRAQIGTLENGVTVPQALWVQEENALLGTSDWIVTGHQIPRSIEGFASAVSGVVGDEITLFVNTTAKSFHVEAYRMGYYQGLGGRLVWTSDTLQGQVQPPPVLIAPTGTVECRWSPSVALKITTDWPPGAYLFKLVGDGGEQQFVPFCVRDDTSSAAFVVQHSVTTWQAYNLWGGYDLYYGLDRGGFTYSMSAAGKSFSSRARIVSFDRPYPQDWAQGASDFIGNEFPLIFDMESLGLDVTYWTDVDLHAHPERLLHHRCLFSLGHDEYWSLEMRNGALSGRDAGVNLAFLGANACYRQIRLERSPLGDNRHEICYKSASEDPLYGHDDEIVTAPSWPSAPTSWPECELVGSMYQDVAADADMVVSDPSSWIWSGTGVMEGQKITKVVQGEYDRFDASLPGPRDVEIAAHSPVVNRGPQRYSDLTWYTAPGGGGVLATGTAAWVNKLSHTTAFPTNVVPAPIPGVTEILLRVMQNVYSSLGAGPGSKTQPSQANWQQLSAGPGAPGTNQSE